MNTLQFNLQLLNTVYISLIVTFNEELIALNIHDSEYTVQLKIT
jgi:hypothetical protein